MATIDPSDTSQELIDLAQKIKDEGMDSVKLAELLVGKPFDSLSEEVSFDKKNLIGKNRSSSGSK